MRTVSKLLATPNFVATRAAALVMVLTMITILSLIVVSLTVAMRIEMESARSYLERSHADFFAREGVEYVKAAILESTPTNIFWVSEPGRLVSSPQTAGAFSSTSTQVQRTNLYSGSATNSTGDAVLAAANFDRLVLSDDDKTVITGATALTSPMNVGWIYVRRDGTRDTSQSPDVSNKSNPLIGRFAYWADDESCRVNLNTAWKRSDGLNTNSVGHPSQIDLPSIPGFTTALADQIQAAALTSQFNSPGEPQRLSGCSQLLSTNRFNFTHRSLSPDINPWGQPKIVLTTQASLAQGRPYLNILTTTNSDPGSLANISSAGLSTVLGQIEALLSRQDWPYATGSFAQKYPTVGLQPSGIAQLALDIIEYVRAAESTNNVVEGIRWPNGGPTTGTSVKTLMGTSRRVMITEMGVWMSDVKTAAGVKYLDSTIKVEIYYPLNYGTQNIDLTKIKIRFAVVVPEGTLWSGLSPVLTSANTSPTSSLSRGGFAVCTWNQTLAAPVAGTRPAKIYLRAALPLITSSSYGEINLPPLWDSAPIAMDEGYQVLIPYTPDAVTVTDPTKISSVQVSDPRVNKYATNWIQTAQNTFGAQNSSWNDAATGSPSPPQDSSTNRVNLLIMPMPKGTTSNSMGVVQSVAELGYITTGVQGNVPWRSLRLQPTPSAPSPPDWALLDLFEAPLSPTNNVSVYLPRTNVIAGKININAAIQPFNAISRSAPIAALLGNISGLSAGTQATIASNIVNRIYAASSTGAKNYGGTNGFVSVGELAEIQGVADSGDESSEAYLRKIVDLCTVRSSVYRVYTLGQALKQAPSGQLIVQGEHYVMAIIERYVDPQTGQVKCRILNWKEIPF
jgi:hypothetical protein